MTSEPGHRRLFASRAYSESETQHTLQLSDTQVLNARLINETHFQFIHDDSSERQSAGHAAINVLGEFYGGGSTDGQNSDSINRYELQNYTSWLGWQTLCQVRRTPPRVAG